MDACSHGALFPWRLRVIVHALAVDTRWGETSETLHAHQAKHIQEVPMALEGCYTHHNACKQGASL